MLLKTLINFCHNFSGFKYTNTIFSEKDNCIYIDIEPKKNSKAICPECKKSYAVYDHQKVRQFLFIPIWGIKVIFSYKPRRVQCKKHGIIVEYMPWAIGKRPVTKVFAIFLSKWAKRLSWSEAGEIFKVSYDIVYASVKYVVDFGLKNRILKDINAIGIDEILFKRGRQFVTLIYEITNGSKRLLWLGLDRKAKTLLKGFRTLGKEALKDIQAVSMDMWKPYIKVVKKKIPQALIILDRFHIMQKFNKAIEDVRKDEARELFIKGEGDVMKNSRWCFLKKRENLTQRQEQRLSELVEQNLKTYKTYLLRESFQKFWTYQAIPWAQKFLHDWINTAMHSNIKPIKRVAKMLKNNKENILNWFKITPRISNGVVEGMNNKIKLIMRKHYGFRTFDAFEIAMYHTMGKLSELELTHSFV